MTDPIKSNYESLINLYPTKALTPISREDAIYHDLLVILKPNKASPLRISFVTNMLLKSTNSSQEKTWCYLKISQLGTSDEELK